MQRLRVVLSSATAALIIASAISVTTPAEARWGGGGWGRGGWGRAGWGGGWGRGGWGHAGWGHAGWGGGWGRGGWGHAGWGRGWGYGGGWGGRGWGYSGGGAWGWPFAAGLLGGTVLGAAASYPYDYYNAYGYSGYPTYSSGYCTCY
jgi:hypothetical protein